MTCLGSHSQEWRTWFQSLCSQSPLHQTGLALQAGEGRPGFESYICLSHAVGCLAYASISSFSGKQSITHRQERKSKWLSTRMLPFAHVKIRTTVRTVWHLSDWPRSKHLLTPVCRASMGGDRRWRPGHWGWGCAQARALGRPGHDRRATGHTSQTPSTSRGVHSSHACAGRHHTMEPAPAVHSARTPLTS